MVRINIPMDSQRCSCTKVSSWLTQRKSWHVLLPSFVEDTLVLIDPINHCKWCFVARLLHWISRQPLAALRCAAMENTRLAQKQLYIKLPFTSQFTQNPGFSRPSLQHNYYHTNGIYGIPLYFTYMLYCIVSWVQPSTVGVCLEVGCSNISMV